MDSTDNVKKRQQKYDRKLNSHSGINSVYS